jgi:hypothetical protein
MIAWEAPCNRGPQEKADHGDLCGTCNHPMAGCPYELRQVGRDGVPAVRRNLGRRGLHPSHRVRWGTVPPRSARKGRTRAPLRNLQPHPMAGCPCELRQAGRDGIPAVRRNIRHRGLCPSHKVPWKGPRPRGPEKCRAQRTAPLPDIVQPWASFDIGQPGRDRVLGVRWKRPVIACQSQAGVPATRLVAAVKG